MRKREWKEKGVGGEKVKDTWKIRNEKLFEDEDSKEIMKAERR